jgi:single-stranded-DNA-specific exonuclease
MKDTHVDLARSTSWTIFDPLPRAQYSEYQQAGIGYLHAQLLMNRGIKTPAAMRSFLDARYDKLLDPLTLTGMSSALERIQRALADREHITVCGDFDADGVTSAALLTRVLRAMKHPDAPLDCFIPHRVFDTRGLSKEAIDKIKTRGTSLIITTDCGSSDFEEVTYAKNLGIDTIITDHHQPPEQLPQAYSMINPWRSDSTYAERYLCGVGIAFKLAQALYRVYNKEHEAQELLDLVAIGTIGGRKPYSCAPGFATTESYKQSWIAGTYPNCKFTTWKTARTRYFIYSWSSYQCCRSYGARRHSFQSSDH